MLRVTTNEAATQPDRVIAPRAAKRSVGNDKLERPEPAKLATEEETFEALLVATASTLQKLTLWRLICRQLRWLGL